MTWTILVLVLGIALFMFGGMLLKQDAKKPSAGVKMVKKAIKVEPDPKNGSSTIQFAILEFFIG